ncbi:MAG: response regulator [Desulfobacteraceae bacterium]|nr:response regulator [Desulfobacteraceae bacterium]
MRLPRVLLIDDEVAFSRTVAEFLRRKGYEADIAPSGEEGLKAMREKTYDVIILDLRMPGLSGMEVLKEIDPSRKLAPEVIILTGFGTVDSGLEGLNYGAFDFLAKPVKVGVLIEKIMAAYERKLMKEA